MTTMTKTTEKVKLTRDQQRALNCINKIRTMVFKLKPRKNLKFNTTDLKLFFEDCFSKKNNQVTAIFNDKIGINYLQFSKEDFERITQLTDKTINNVSRYEINSILMPRSIYHIVKNMK
jgi:hypothetical protein